MFGNSLLISKVAFVSPEKRDTVIVIEKIKQQVIMKIISEFSSTSVHFVVLL